MFTRSASSKPRTGRGLSRNSSASGFVAFAFAAVVSWHPVLAHAEEPESGAGRVWYGTHGDLSWPLGSFDPPGTNPLLGFGGDLSIHSGHSPIGMRFEFGLASSQVHIDSVLAESPIGFSSYAGVTAGNNLWWFLMGAHWDPRPRHTSVYAFTSLGVLRVSPQGVAGNGPILRPEVPGLPGSSNVLAYNLGAGSRLVVGKSQRLGFTAEVEYLHGGAADYISSAGVEGSNPTHYASRNAPISFYSLKLGFVVQR